MNQSKSVKYTTVKVIVHIEEYMREQSISAYIKQKFKALYMED